MSRKYSRTPFWNLHMYDSKHLQTGKYLRKTHRREFRRKWWQTDLSPTHLNNDVDTGWQWWQLPSLKDALYARLYLYYVLSALFTLTHLIPTRILSHGLILPVLQTGKWRHRKLKYQRPHCLRGGVVFLTQLIWFKLNASLIKQRSVRGIFLKPSQQIDWLGAWNRPKIKGREIRSQHHFLKFSADLWQIP